MNEKIAVCGEVLGVEGAKNLGQLYSHVDRLHGSLELVQTTEHVVQIPLVVNPCVGDAQEGVPFKGSPSNDGNPLVDGRWGRVVGREGAERSSGQCHGFGKDKLYFHSCEPYSTSNKTEY